MSEIYPLTIIASRYGGTYEGAPYVAFNDYAYHVANAECNNSMSCAAFFATYPGHIGRGTTPHEAYMDLQRKMNPGAFHG